MFSFTVYERKDATGEGRELPDFRVVAGEHPPVTTPDDYSVSVYQGSDPEAAAHAAHSNTQRADIREQIARFISG